MFIITNSFDLLPVVKPLFGCSKRSTISKYHNLNFFDVHVNTRGFTIITNIVTQFNLFTSPGLVIYSGGNLNLFHFNYQSELLGQLEY